MIDFDAVMLAPIYATLGVSATLTLPDDREFTLTVIDKTSGAANKGLILNARIAASDIWRCTHPQMPF